MKSQSDSPITTDEALARIRAMRPGTFQVPSEDYPRMRAIALKFGADHLGGYEGTLTEDQLNELKAYTAIVDQLVREGKLLVQELPIKRGRVGIARDMLTNTDLIYVLPD